MSMTAGRCELDQFGTLDVDFVVDYIGSHKVPLASRRALMAIVWGTLPTPEWRGRHGWKADWQCLRCGAPDGLLHCLVGCRDANPEASTAAFEEWRQALVGKKLEEPKVEGDALNLSGLLTASRSRSTSCALRPALRFTPTDPPSMSGRGLQPPQAPRSRLAPTARRGQLPEQCQAPCHRTPFPARCGGSHV